jgi:hypothetical protein
MRDVAACCWFSVMSAMGNHASIFLSAKKGEDRDMLFTRCNSGANLANLNSQMVSGQFTSCFALLAISSIVSQVPYTYLGQTP